MGRSLNHCSEGLILTDRRRGRLTVPCTGYSIGWDDCQCSGVRVNNLVLVAVLYRVIITDLELLVGIVVLILWVLAVKYCHVDRGGNWGR